VWNGHVVSTGGSIDGTYVMVYLLAPVLGCVVAAMLWAVVATTLDFAVSSSSNCSSSSSGVVEMVVVQCAFVFY
jgi:uncharacterized membrane protein